jgi:hypothetical protein
MQTRTWHTGVSAINPLDAVYDVYGGKRKVLFFYFVPDTTQAFFKLDNKSAEFLFL